MSQSYLKPVVAIVVGAIIIGAIFMLESRKADQGSNTILKEQDIVIKDESERVAQKAKEFERAKEISSPDGFINTDGVTVEEFVGEKIILVDFWTYSCINCQRTLPYLNDWHEKYGDKGLVILGVHTPEFDFEKDYQNVQRAVEKYDIKYPVVLDNDFSTWRSYKNQYWPRKYLIDIDGFIVYDHIGEGSYEETEKKIVELLNERSHVLGEQMVELDTSLPEGVDNVDFSQVRSPEMYFGSTRIEYLRNLPEEKCLTESCAYTSGGPLQVNTFQLSGTWKIGDEHAQLESGSGSIFLGFYANKVNLVAGSDLPVRAEIYLDGEKVGDFGGRDVNGSAVTFKEEDLYNVVDLGGAYGQHLLEIRILDGGLSAFAFTFG